LCDQIYTRSGLNPTGPTMIHTHREKKSV